MSMSEYQEINNVKRILHRMARYLFEHDGGEIDQNICLPKMETGECPFANVAAGTCNPDVCAECLIAQFSSCIEESRVTI